MERFIVRGKQARGQKYSIGISIQGCW